MIVANFGRRVVHGSGTVVRSCQISMIIRKSDRNWIRIGESDQILSGFDQTLIDMISGY